MVRNPYGFVLTVSIIAFVLHFFVPWMTASTIIALVTMPIAEGLGFHPFIPVLVALIAGDHTIVPYVVSSATPSSTSRAKASSLPTPRPGGHSCSRPCSGRWPCS